MDESVITSNRYSKTAALIRPKEDPPREDLPREDPPKEGSAGGRVKDGNW